MTQYIAHFCPESGVQNDNLSSGTTGIMVPIGMNPQQRAHFPDGVTIRSNLAERNINFYSEFLTELSRFFF